MKKEKRFKTAFCGFQKKSVITYIQTLSEQFDRSLTAKEERLEELQREISSLRSQLSSCQTVSAETPVTDDLLALQEENESLRQENKQLQKRIQDIPSVAEEMLRQQKIEIADVLVRAEAASRKIIDEAMLDAEAKKMGIEQEIQAKRAELSLIQKEVDSVRQMFSDLYNRYVEEPGSQA